MFLARKLFAMCGLPARQNLGDTPPLLSIDRKLVTAKGLGSS